MAMLEDVAAAFARGDYREAERLLKLLRQEMPDNPWVEFYVGRLYEAAGDWPRAEAIYRQTLKQAMNPKLVSQARQGLQRLKELEENRRKQAIATARQAPDSDALGCLVLEAVQGANRDQAIQNFARILKMDAYTARLQLSSRGWRFYRTGQMAELTVYGQELEQAGIPNLRTPLPTIQNLRVFRVQHFQTTNPGAIAICLNHDGQVGALSFNWSEVKQRVSGRLPIFEEVVDLDPYRNLVRKQETQDYSQVYDLHLPQRQCILRLHDQTYEFHQDPNFSDPSSDTRTTLRQNWNALMQTINVPLQSAPLWDEFTDFAETVLEQDIFWEQIPAHINLVQKQVSGWNPCFHLYSSLIFLHKSQPAPTLN